MSDVVYTTDLADRIGQARLTTDELIAAVRGQGFVVTLPEESPHGVRWGSMTRKELGRAAGWCMLPAQHRALRAAWEELSRRADN